MAVFPCAVQYIFVVLYTVVCTFIYFIHSSLYLLILYSCLAPASYPFPTGNC